MERIWEREVRGCAELLAGQSRYIEPKKYLADLSVYLCAIECGEREWREALRRPDQRNVLRYLADVCALNVPAGYEPGEAFEAVDKNGRSVVEACLWQVAEGAQAVEEGAAKFFRELLEYMIVHESLNDFVTPYPLAEFMARLLAPAPNERVLDPVCGSGRMLLAAARQCGACLLTGIDVEAVWIALAKMQLFLEGRRRVRLECMNFFSYEGEDFDAVLANPPYYDDLSLTIRFIEKILSVLKRAGRCAVLVPEGFLTSGVRAAAAMRRQILEQNTLEGVIALPRKIYKPYTESNSSLLLMRRGAAEPYHRVFMAKIPEREGTENEAGTYGADMERIVKGWMSFHGCGTNEDGKWGFWWEAAAEEIKKRGYIFAADAYREERPLPLRRPMAELYRQLGEDRRLLQSLLETYGE